MSELEEKIKDAKSREMALRLRGNYIGAKQERARIKNLERKIAIAKGKND